MISGTGNPRKINYSDNYLEKNYLGYKEITGPSHIILKLYELFGGFPRNSGLRAINVIEFRLLYPSG